MVIIMIMPWNQGEDHPKAKLTEMDVLEIRKNYLSGIGCYRLARRFGVHPVTIGKIVRRETWKHI